MSGGYTNYSAAKIKAAAFFANYFSDKKANILTEVLYENIYSRI